MHFFAVTKSETVTVSHNPVMKFFLSNSNSPRSSLVCFLQPIVDYLLHNLEDLMAKGAREPVKLKSSESTECYWTVKNKRNTTERMELKKYDKKLKRHVIFKEAK